MNLWGSVLLRLDTMYKFRIYTNLEQSIVMGQNHLSSQGVNPTTSKVMYLIIFLWKHRLKCLLSMFSFHGK